MCKQDSQSIAPCPTAIVFSNYTTHKDIQVNFLLLLPSRGDKPQSWPKFIVPHSLISNIYYITRLSHELVENL